ncbi:Transcriptional regulator MraZ [bacterium HR30]|nr:Transcriptional regulator MraZ [bacterium HR30]
MFRGTFEHTVDEKGRVSVPARFRAYLEYVEDRRVVVTNFQIDGVPCLDVYPLLEWLKLEEQLRAKPQFDPGVLRFVMYYVGSAHDCEIDGQGRIFLPPTLREYAGLKRHVVFASAIHKFRIWDRDNWRKVHAAASEVTKQPELLQQLGV